MPTVLLPVGRMTQHLSSAGQAAAVGAIVSHVKEQQDPTDCSLQSSLAEEPLAVCTEAPGKANPQLSRQGRTFFLMHVQFFAALKDCCNSRQSNKHLWLQVVEHDDGLLGEGDELDIFTTDLVARSQLDTAGSSMNGSTAIMMEAALSSAVMHPNVVQTYDYETRSSTTSGGQVPFSCMPSAQSSRLTTRVVQALHVTQCKSIAFVVQMLCSAQTVQAVSIVCAQLIAVFTCRKPM